VTSIERTAYPRFKRHYTPNELGEIYTPTRIEINFALKVTTGEENYFNLLVLLKVFQRLGYFPQIADIPLAVIDQIRAALHLREDRSFSYQYPPTPGDSFQSKRQGSNNRNHHSISLPDG
jgi:hypothetical protein